MTVSRKKKDAFIATVWSFYHANNRSGLPWRVGITPYKVWVSEIMLQQTQVDRVIPFFRAWIKKFPTIAKLAQASQLEVLKMWKGLGYNSRALRMKKAAEIVLKEHGGKFPKTLDQVLELPGVGPYTAGAIMAFAYNHPTAFIETNIRRVYIHHFYQHPQPPLKEGAFGAPSFRGGQRDVLIHDKDLMKLIEETVDRENPREWYWALMDYGSYLGKTIPNPNKKSRHYSVQKKFKGSDREIRGAILGVLLDGKKVPVESLLKKLGPVCRDHDRVEGILSKMEEDGFCIVAKGSVFLKK